MLELADKRTKMILAGIIALGILGSLFYGFSSQFDEAGDSPEKLLNQARELYYQGKYEASIEAYQQVLELEVNKKQKDYKGQARSNLAVLYQEQGKYDLAVKKYQKLLEEREDYGFRLELGISYYNLGELTKAKEELTKIIMSDVTIEEDYILRDANYYLSLIYSRLGDNYIAEHCIRQALGHDQFALGYYQLGELRFAEGDYQGAIKYYKEALEQDGSLKGVDRKIALSYLELNKIKSAVRYLQAAKQENSNDRLIIDKLASVKEEYPEYFESKDKGEKDPVEDKEEKPPASVEFEQIQPVSPAGREIKVGIMEDKSKIYFRVGSDFVVKEDERVIAEGKKGELYQAQLVNGKYLLQLGESQVEFKEAIKIVPEAYVPIVVHNVEYGQGYYWAGSEDRQYRGLLELNPSPEGITAINLVRMEEYLMGVIPAEMSSSWPLTALKVQAVAARSYTLANLNKHQEKAYDLCSTTHCAAYRGIGRETPKVIKAVKETLGEVMTYDGRPINAVYSANSGGHTENSEDVWSFEVPYLKGVSTTKQKTQFPLAPVELKKWLKKTPRSYSNYQQFTKPSHYRWQRNISVDYLESSLGIKDIQKIIPTNRGLAGSVQSVRVVGAEQEKVFKHNLRSKLGELRNNRFWIQPQYKEGELVSFLFYGSGWGHSVGMDQVAVAGMAKEGHDYQKILKHFYSNIIIEDRY